MGPKDKIRTAVLTLKSRKPVKETVQIDRYSKCQFNEQSDLGSIGVPLRYSSRHAASECVFYSTCGLLRRRSSGPQVGQDNPEGQG
jgi:hypothetical protein